MRLLTCSVGCLVLALTQTSVAGGAGDDDPFADAVVEYDPGTGAAPAYMNPASALGEPTRFTGIGIDPGVVSPYQPAFGTSEIVSIGAGGSLTVRFDTPVTDDPNNFYGVDLIVFGNTLLIDCLPPNGDFCGAFGEGGVIEVSEDGEHFVAIPGLAADGLFPTMGYVDSGPYDSFPGQVPTDFTRPVNPQGGFVGGVGYQGIINMYRGSGGGVSVDLASVGMTAITHVRISVPLDNFGTPEIDAIVDASPRLPGDANLDGMIDVFDILAVLENWGMPLSPSWIDMNDDGMIDVFDLLLVLENWTP